MKKRICAAACILMLVTSAPAAVCVPVWAEEAQTESELITYDAPVKKETKPDMLMIRSLPSAKSSAYGMLGKGEIVEVLGEISNGEGQWYLIHTKEGRDAYLSGAYLLDPQTDPADKEEPDAQDQTAPAEEEEQAGETAPVTEEAQAGEAAPAAGEAQADEAAPTAGEAQADEASPQEEADTNEEKIPSQSDPEHGFIFVRNEDGTVTVTKY